MRASQPIRIPKPSGKSLIENQAEHTTFLKGGSVELLGTLLLNLTDIPRERKRLGGWGYVYTIYGNTMKDVRYKIKCIRMNEETWKILKEKRVSSGLSWNMFLLKLLKDKKNESSKNNPKI